MVAKARSDSVQVCRPTISATPPHATGSHGLNAPGPPADGRGQDRHRSTVGSLDPLPLLGHAHECTTAPETYTSRDMARMPAFTRDRWDALSRGAVARAGGGAPDAAAAAVAWPANAPAIRRRAGAFRLPGVLDAGPCPWLIAVGPEAPAAPLPPPLAPCAPPDSTPSDRLGPPRSRASCSGCSGDEVGTCRGAGLAAPADCGAGHAPYPRPAPPVLASTAPAEYAPKLRELGREAGAEAR